MPPESVSSLSLVAGCEVQEEAPRSNLDLESSLLCLLLTNDIRRQAEGTIGDHARIITSERGECHLAGYAAVASASILGFSGGVFSAAARPGQRLHPYLAQTWHSKIEIRDEYRK